MAVTYPPHTRAYSYVRFSTPEQLKGDSLRRQTEAARKYADTHGLILDTALSMRDLGISAYRGANAESGALGAFLKAVEEGRIPRGSVLLVENLDRISRAKVLDAFNTFTSIIQADIEIVTLMDGIRYSKASLNANLGQLMTSIAFFAMANEESTKKGIRVSASWQAKRKAALVSGAIMTKRTPYWIETDAARSKFTLHEERTDVVRTIIGLAEKGTGNSSICRHLNLSGVPAWNKEGKWQPSYIQKILQNPALYGALKVDDQLRDGYYPAVITFDRWSLLQAMRSSRRTTLKANRKGATVTNLFSGLLKCGYCGRPMAVAGYKSHVTGYERKYYGCQGARTGATACKMRMWFIDELEPDLLFWLTRVDYRRIVGMSDESNHRAEVEKLAGMEQRIADAERRITNVTNAIEEGAKGMVARLTALEAERDRLQAAIEGQRRIVDAAASRTSIGQSRMTALVALFKALKSTKDEASLRTLREQLSAAIHAVVERIDLYPAGRKLTGTKDERFIDVTFSGGETRRIEPHECGGAAEEEHGNWDRSSEAVHQVVSA